jgi:pimeloyl-ACP methyl ester carboxylesterase
MPIVRTPSTHIHYEIRGGGGAGAGAGGRAVVLLQGLGLSSRYWFDAAERLIGIDSSRRVVLVDNRGTGKSGRPPPFGWPPWTVAAMADDVAAVLEDAGIARALVVGISMGGMIAQHVALRHPGKVEGLVLLATSPGVGLAVPPRPKAMALLMSLPLGGSRASRNLVRLLLPPSKWESAREIFRDWPHVMRDDPTSPATFAAHLFAASTHYAGGELSRIGCPVVVAAGTEDVLIPSKNAEKLAKRIPGAELVLVEGAGHALVAEDRDLLGRLVARLEARIAERPAESALGAVT